MRNAGDQCKSGRVHKGQISEAANLQGELGFNFDPRRATVFRGRASAGSEEQRAAQGDEDMRQMRIGDERARVAGAQVRSEAERWSEMSQWVEALIVIPVAAPVAWLVHSRIHRLKVKCIDWLMAKIAGRWPSMFALRCETCGAVVALGRGEQHDAICHGVVAQKGGE